MAEQMLTGRRILLAEDEYLIATDMRDALHRAGAEVLGPVATVEDAQQLLGSDGKIDAAVLDVNLRGDMVFSVADTLHQRGVPFIFATGYDAGAIPDRFSEDPRLEKPLQGREIADVLEPLLSSRRR